MTWVYIAYSMEAMHPHPNVLYLSVLILYPTERYKQDVENDVVTDGQTE